MTLPPPAAAFLDAPPRLARVATVNPDGSPHIVPMWFIRDGGRLGFTSRRGRATVRNILRDDRIACVVDDEDPRRYAAVVIDGRAQLLEHGVPDLVRRIARRYLPPPDGDRYADYMLGQSDRVAFVVIPDRISSWGLDAPDTVGRLLRGERL